MVPADLVTSYRVVTSNPLSGDAVVAYYHRNGMLLYDGKVDLQWLPAGRGKFSHADEITQKIVREALPAINFNLSPSADSNLLCSMNLSLSSPAHNELRKTLNELISQRITYEGEIREGCYHGNGKLTWPDGYVIYGIFERSVFVKGVKQWPAVGRDGKLDGRIESGVFRDGFLVDGAQRTLDGRIVEGTFKGCDFNGKVTITYPDGHKFIATYEEGRQVSNGTHITPLGQKTEYLSPERAEKEGCTIL